MHTIHSRWRKPKKRRNRRSISMQMVHLKKKIQLENEIKTDVPLTEENVNAESNDRALQRPVMDGRTFAKHLKMLAQECNRLKNSLLRETRKCIAEAYINCNPDLKSKDVLDIAVLYDGLWRVHDSTTVYGISCVIDILTGLVVDFGILSKYCYPCSVAASELGDATKEYEMWKNEHKASGDCSKNYDGSLDATDITAAEILWQRSERHSNMRYTTLLCCDNDSQILSHLNDTSVYNICIKKENCLDYIVQWLNIGLKAIVKESRKEAVYLGSRKEGMLKADTIYKLVSQYKNAIIENSPNIEEIKSTIFAAIEHAASTDDNPCHEKCPLGNASWCFYNRALFEGTVPPSHADELSMKLNSIVMEKINPLYEMLTAEDLLSRCVYNETQTANQRLHEVFWKKCTNEVLRSKKRMELAAVSAIAEFNMGTRARLSCKLQELETKMNIFCAAEDIANQRDKERNGRSTVEPVEPVEPQVVSE